MVIAQPGRIVKDISSNSWKLWLDRKATWIDDTLYPPPVDISVLPVNAPTGGWDALAKGEGRTSNAACYS